MIIQQAKLYQYRLALKIPMAIKNHLLKEREGYLLVLHSNTQIEGIGEIAPLPYYSSENLEKVHSQLKRLISIFPSLEIPNSANSLSYFCQKLFEDNSLSPSIQFGVEMALMNLVANSQHQSLNHWLSKSTHDNIHISGLLQGSQAQVVAQAKALLEQKYRSFKLKVGENIEDDIAKVRALDEALQGKALLHVDANQAWDINQAVYFGHEVGLAAVEYVEEPFKNLEDIPDFFMKTTIPVALDESLQFSSPEKIRSLEGVDVLILKPTLLGGIHRIQKWMHDAKQFALDVVISSCFESDIGLLTLAHLAGSIPRDNFAGLDTLRFFSKGLLKNPLSIQQGRLNTHGRHVTTQDIDINELKEIL